MVEDWKKLDYLSETAPHVSYTSNRVELVHLINLSHSLQYQLKLNMKNIKFETFSPWIRKSDNES